VEWTGSLFSTKCRFTRLKKSSRLNKFVIRYTKRDIAKTSRKVISSKMSGVYNRRARNDVNKAATHIIESVQFRKCPRVTSRRGMTSRNPRASPGVLQLDCGTERRVRVKLGDAHRVAATVRRARCLTDPRAPTNRCHRQWTRFPGILPNSIIPLRRLSRNFPEVGVMQFGLKGTSRVCRRLVADVTGKSA